MKHIIKTATKCLTCGALVFLWACHQKCDEITPSLGTSAVSMDFSGIIVPQSSTYLYSNVETYNLIQSSDVATKTTCEEVSLEQLLNKGESKTTEFQGVLFEQIAFRQNNENVWASYGVGEMAPAEASTRIKKYLIQTSGLSYEEPKQFIVSLISDKTYFETHPDFDYFNRPNYTGIVLFSSINGEFKKANIYKNGRIIPAEVISAQDQNESDEAYYITVFEQAITKQEYITYWSGAPAICIGFRPMNDFIGASFCFGILYSGGGSGGGGSDGINHQSSGSVTDHMNYTSDKDAPIKPSPEELKYTVRISTNCPEDIRMVLDDEHPGYSPDDFVQSSVIEFQNVANEVVAEYVAGSYGTVYPSYVREDHEINIEDFRYWSGYFKAIHSDNILFSVECNFESTAYYGPQIPCRDTLRGIVNPLHRMSVAASNATNYKGGTFGKTRKKWQVIDSVKVLVPRNHSGLDLAATIGTPVYALYDGVIIKAYASAPNNYYNKRAFGNELHVKSFNMNGDFFIVQYAHLNYGTPFAVNPRTGRTFKNGDIVYQGDLIGYTGKTGNAYYVPNPHLHLGIKVNGKWVDPKDYINGTIDTLRMTSGKIYNIKCD